MKLKWRPKHLKRRYSGLPEWLDYLCQALYWLEYHWPKPPFGSWASALLDEHCRCEKCEGRYQRARKEAR